MHGGIRGQRPNRFSQVGVTRRSAPSSAFCCFENNHRHEPSGSGSQSVFHQFDSDTDPDADPVTQTRGKGKIFMHHWVRHMAHEQMIKGRH
jgi:hypothetical protein